MHPKSKTKGSKRSAAPEPRAEQQHPNRARDVANLWRAKEAALKRKQFALAKQLRRRIRRMGFWQAAKPHATPVQRSK
jgi:hypothetical protein